VQLLSPCLISLILACTTFSTYMVDRFQGEKNARIRHASSPSIADPRITYTIAKLTAGRGLAYLLDAFPAVRVYRDARASPLPLDVRHPPLQQHEHPRAPGFRSSRQLSPPSAQRTDSAGLRRRRGLVTSVSDGSARSALLRRTTARRSGSRGPRRRRRGSNDEEAGARASRTSRTRSTRGRRARMARSAEAMWRPYHAPERPRTAAPRRRDTASAAGVVIVAETARRRGRSV
jgi:hypothetical protein